MILPETILHDLKYGIRALSGRPWSSAITILSLALGIGVNTAVFTAHKAFVDRPLDARNPGELVNIALRRDSGSSEYAFSYPDYEAYRESVRGFTGLIAFRPARVTISNAGGMVDQRTSYERSPIATLMAPGASNAEFAFVFIVSDNYFRVLGVPALHGRTFRAWKYRRLGGPSIRSGERKLLAKTIWRRSCDPRQDSPPGWHRRHNHWSYAA